MCDILKQIYINKENIEYLTNCMLKFSKKKLDIFDFIGETISKSKMQGKALIINALHHLM